MPLYEYKCSKCGHIFEEIEKYDNRKEKQECPECGKRTGKLVDEPQVFTYSQGRSFSRMRHGK